MHKLDFSEITGQIMTYQQYNSLLNDLLSIGKTTGNDQTEHRLEIAKLNQQRVKRLDKTIKIYPFFEDFFNNSDLKISVLVITEGWCGDSAQIIPWVEKVAESSYGKIKTYYILRDENPIIMDMFLTNGSRAIPKVIFFNEDNGIVFKTWGPRPIKIQEWFLETKKNHPDLAKEDLELQLHQFYTQNKGVEIMNDLRNILEQINQVVID